MNKKKYCDLTVLEEELMEWFWKIDEPLTSVDIPDIAVGHTWNDSYLHILLKSLLKKEMIQISGFVQCGRQYVRQFTSTITKEEYFAKFIFSKGLGKSSAAKVAVAIVEEECKEEDQEKQIIRLEEDIKKIRERKAAKK